MTENELREKIARIIAKHLCKNRHSHFQLYGDSANCYSRENFAECEAIADTVEALIAAEIGDESEYKHRAEKEEKLKNQYCRALLNLARRYVVKTNMTLPHGNELNSRDVDIEMLALYIMANECEQSENELQEERKDD